MLRPNISLLLVLALAACSGNGRLSPFLQPFDNQAVLECPFNSVWDASLNYARGLRESDDSSNAYIFADRTAGLITYSIEQRISGLWYGGVRTFVNHTIVVAEVKQGTEIFYHVGMYAPYNPVSEPAPGGTDDLLVFDSPTPHLRKIAMQLEVQKTCQ